MRMNILFVNNFRGRGGGEEFLRELLPGLVAKGMRVGLVCRPGSPLTEMFKGSTVSVYPVERSGLGFYTSVFIMASIIRNGGYEIVNIQRAHDIIQSWVSSLLSRRRPKLIYTVQVAEFMRSNFFLSRLDSIVAVSRYIKENIAGFSASAASKTTVINYGIDSSALHSAREERGFIRNRFGISDDAPVIGTVGDLWKNQIEFLDALIEIRREYPDARLALVASETGIGQVNAFKDRVSELGLQDAVIWAGRLSKADMKFFYADIDIAVSTHRNEGFGIWVLEALAMGKPVVAFNEGGIRDSLENCPAGVLVDGGAMEMAQEVIRILRDPWIISRAAEAGPRWVAEHFSRERMVEEYYRFFQSIVNGA